MRQEHHWKESIHTHKEKQVLNPTGCRMLSSMWISQRLSQSLGHDMEGYSLRFRSRAGGQRGKVEGFGEVPVSLPSAPPGFPGLLSALQGLLLHEAALEQRQQNPWPPHRVPARPWKLRVDLINQGQEWGRVKRRQQAHMSCVTSAQSSGTGVGRGAGSAYRRKGWFLTRDSSTGVNKGAWGWKPSFHYELCTLGLSLSSHPFLPSVTRAWKAQGVLTPKEWVSSGAPDPSASP